MLPNSMWEATANERPSYPRVEGNHSCDVVIIGGGFTGLSAAYHLQEMNVDTIVLEKDRVGTGASGRNGGEVLTGYLGSMEGIAKSKGLEEAKEMWKLSLESIDLIESIIDKNNIQCDFVRNGHFNGAHKRNRLKGMRQNQKFMSKYLNYNKIDIVEEKNIKNELNTDFYYGGEIDLSSAHFHPLNYTLGLAKVASSKGARIFEESAATKIKYKKKDKVIIEKNRGRIIANDLIIATNGYADDIHKTIKKSVVPIESIMIATESLNEEIMNDIIPKNRAVFDTKNLLYYFRRTADNRLAFGGSGRASSQRDSKKLFDNLHKGMLEVYPQLKHAKIEYNWGGKVGFTSTMLPHIGQLKNGAYFGYGYGGHGSAMSTMFGKIIAKSIVKGHPIENPLMIDKLKPIPFHSHHAKGVSLVKFYKQIQDILT